MALVSGVPFGVPAALGHSEHGLHLQSARTWSREATAFAERPRAFAASAARSTNRSFLTPQLRSARPQPWHRPRLAARPGHGPGARGHGHAAFHFRRGGGVAAIHISHRGLSRPATPAAGAGLAGASASSAASAVSVATVGQTPAGASQTPAASAQSTPANTQAASATTPVSELGPTPAGTAPAATSFPADLVASPSELGPNPVTASTPVGLSGQSETQSQNESAGQGDQGTTTQTGEATTGESGQSTTTQDGQGTTSTGESGESGQGTTTQGDQGTTTTDGQDTTDQSAGSDAQNEAPGIQRRLAASLFAGTPAASLFAGGTPAASSLASTPAASSQTTSVPAASVPSATPVATPTVTSTGAPSVTVAPGLAGSPAASSAATAPALQGGGIPSLQALSAGDSFTLPQRTAAALLSGRNAVLTGLLGRTGTAGGPAGSIVGVPGSAPFGLAIAPTTGATLGTTTATTAPGRPAASGRGKSAHASAAATPDGSSLPFSLPTVTKLVSVIPQSVWIALAASLALAGVGAGSAVALGRRMRRQAGEMAVVSAAALTDPLTGVLNRRGFSEALERELARSRRYGRPFVLAYVDVRGLKGVNDSEGHLAGDELLKTATGVLVNSARKHDVIGRLGGDEFAVLLPEQAGSAAGVITERIAERVQESRTELGFSAPWDLTVGTAAYPEDGDSAEELIAVADRRLYEQRGIELGNGNV